MVVTILKAQVAPDRAARLVDGLATATEKLPPMIVETFLLREVGSDQWRIVTVWESQEALEEYRRSIDTPEGVTAFRSAGAEPALAIFEVIHRAGG